ncbi:hypothetical protein [Leptolyngbya sp. CCY15150]|uniref:hypothetical protein n=1 Tax=Leptolyngbya sp. CCY15150 TaxID=2767772 RepID=UPI0019519297
MDEPPLVAIGEQRHLLICLSQPLNHPRYGPLASANAQACRLAAPLLAIGHKYRKDSTSIILPNPTGLNLLAGNGLLCPITLDGGALLPKVLREPQHLFQHRIQQGAKLALVAIPQAGNIAPQLIFDVARQGR